MTGQIDIKRPFKVRFIAKLSTFYGTKDIFLTDMRIFFFEKFVGNLSRYLLNEYRSAVLIIGSYFENTVKIHICAVVSEFCESN